MDYIPGWFEITVEVDGKKYTGQYTYSKGFIKVSYGGCSKEVEAENFAIRELMARSLLINLVKKEKSDLDVH